MLEMRNRFAAPACAHQQPRPIELSRGRRRPLAARSDDLVEQRDCCHVVFTPQVSGDLPGEQQDFQPAGLDGQTTRGVPQTGNRARRVSTRERVQR